MHDIEVLKAQIAELERNFEHLENEVLAMRAIVVVLLKDSSMDSESIDRGLDAYRKDNPGKVTGEARENVKSILASSGRSRTEQP